MIINDFVGYWSSDDNNVNQDFLRNALHRFNLPSTSSENPLSMVEEGGTEFDPNDIQYSCCCGQCSAKTGAMVSGVANVTLILTLFILDAANFVPVLNMDLIPSQLRDVSALFMSCAIIIGLVLLSHGLYSNSLKEIAAYIVIQIAWTLFVLYDIICDAIRMSYNTQRAATDVVDQQQQVEAVEASVAICLLVIVELMQIWSLATVVSCYKLVKYGRRMLEHGSAERGYGSPSTGGHPPPYHVALMFPTRSQRCLAAAGDDLPSYATALYLAGSNPAVCHFIEGRAK